MVKSQTALGSKSHLGSFAQVLGQHYEVDQCLRVAAVLIEIREREEDALFSACLKFLTERLSLTCCRSQ